MDGTIAVLLLEDTQLYVAVGQLPPGSAEGQWLLVYVENGEFVGAKLDLEKTQQVKERISAKRALLLERMALRRRDE